MALSDRDYMRERVKRTLERERRDGEIMRWPPPTWVVVTAVAIVAMWLFVYVF